jgi:hypothetical protein
MSEPFKFGEIVTVKCVDGTDRTLVVWESNERMVWVSSSVAFDSMTAGRHAPPPIGFPIKDITKATS